MKSGQILEIQLLMVDLLQLQIVKSEIPVPKIQGESEILNLPEFIDLLSLQGNDIHITYLSNRLKEDQLNVIFDLEGIPLILFREREGKIIPCVVFRKNKQITLFEVTEEELIKSTISPGQLINLSNTLGSKLQAGDDLYVVCCIPHERFTDEVSEVSGKTKKLKPLQKLFRLISWEKRDIGYLYFYSIISGVIGLSLPLGIQSIISFMQSGQITTSVVVLISIVIVGILITGGLQIMQLWIMEFIQQRLFAKTAFEFSYKLPRIHPNALRNQYAPELMNRFFDIISLQKGLSGMLLDFSSALLQVVFGLVLLSLYHSSFIIFGVVLISIIFFILRSTGPKGLDSSMRESKYKYLTANWLQNVGRALFTFRNSGFNNYPHERLDYYVSNYLHARKKHFRVLIKQYWSFVGFKVLITAGLLILGCLLLINKEINIGQFVASEIIIILIVNSVEKAILKMETVYDVLTSIEKIDQVIQIKENNDKGLILKKSFGKGFHIRLDQVSFTIEDGIKKLDNLSFDINQGELINICGLGNSGKGTLLNLLSCNVQMKKGVILFNAIPANMLHRGSLSEHIGKILPYEKLFDGSVSENISLGKKHVDYKDVSEALRTVELEEEVNRLPDGQDTIIVAGEEQFPIDWVNKLIIARAICNKPSLLLIDDTLLGKNRKEKQKMLENITEAVKGTTVVLVSNQLSLMQLCTKSALLENGKLIDFDKPELVIKRHSNEQLFY